MKRVITTIAALAVLSLGPTALTMAETMTGDQSIDRGNAPAATQQTTAESTADHQMGLSGSSGEVKPGESAPLPYGEALGTGPASLTGEIPPGTHAPALGAGAPVGQPSQ